MQWQLHYFAVNWAGQPSGGNTSWTPTTNDILSRTLHEARVVWPAGESQKIDRIMERFAERYCKDNPDVFKTADGAYVLSFALIMLNTDAHNPMAEKKLSVADFVGMCQYQVQYSLLVHDVSCSC